MKLLSAVVVLAACGCLSSNASAHHAPYLGIQATWGGQGPGPGQFQGRTAESVATGPDGSIAALESPGVIVRFDRDGKFLARWGGRPGDPDMSLPQDIAVGASGAVYVTVDALDPNSNVDRVLKFSPTGDLLAAWSGSDGTPAFEGVEGITSDLEGNLYIETGFPGARAEERRILQLTEEGILVRELGPTGGLQHLARDSDGYFYGPLGGALARMTPEGAFDGFIGQWNLRKNHIAQGAEVAADGSIWVADPGEYRLQRLSRAGELLDTCGPTGDSMPLNYPVDVTPSGDEVVIADPPYIRRIGMVTHPATPCDAMPPTLTNVELDLSGGPRKWFKRSGVRLSTSEPSHAGLTLQQRVRRQRRTRWHRLDRGRADVQAGENSLDFSDVLEVTPRPKAGSYRIKLRLDDEADNLSPLRTRRLRIK